MVATIQDLTPCSTYSLQIGAGPFVYREGGGASSYSDGVQEELLSKAINKIWASEENAFKAFAITAPVSIKSISGSQWLQQPRLNISSDCSSHSLSGGKNMKFI